MPAVTPATAADLAFLAPGLVHQLGNLFFGLQAHALHADPQAAGPALQAIASVADRGGACVRLLRHALGDGGPEPGEARRAVADLGEMLRVSMREAGHRLETEAGDDGRRSVDLAHFVPGALAALRGVCAALPTGMEATVRLCWRDAVGELEVAVAPAAGSLPFPVAFAALAQAWTARAETAGWGLRAAATPTGLLLRVAQP
jgi:hypothetical protein